MAQELQELISIPDSDALIVFTNPGKLDPILARVRSEIDAFVPPEVDTLKGRKEIASFAFKVAKSRTYLEAVGKTLAAQAKEIPKKIDASRKLARETLEQWEAEVRKPLTEWEEAEDARVNAHKTKLDGYAQFLSVRHADENALTLAAKLREAEAIRLGPECEEFEVDYGRAKEAAIAHLASELEKRKVFEAEQAELARLRQEAAEREARDRDARIAAEAAKAAEERAARKAQEERDAVENAARAEREAAAHREAELIRQKEDADRRAAETEARVKREAEEAAQIEAAETKRREDNKAHRAKINRAAITALVNSCNIDVDTAKNIIIQIVTRQIPNVSISY